MKNIALSQANDSIGESVRGCAGEPLVRTEAVVPIDDLDLETLALGSNPRFLAILEQARGQYREGFGLSAEVVRRELGSLRGPKRSHRANPATSGTRLGLSDRLVWLDFLNGSDAPLD